MTLRAHTAVVTIIGAVAAAALTACGSPAPQGENAGGGAGVSAQVGDVRLLNLLIVATQDGGKGIICGRGENTSDQARSVDIRLASGSETTVAAPAARPLDLNCEGPDPIVLDNVGAPPGALADATVTAGGQSSQVRIPVLYPYSVTPYGTLAPPGTTPAPAAPTGQSATTGG